MPSLFIVVPVFNEKPNIDTLFDAFTSLTQEFSDLYTVSFLVVDDGSSDGTATYAAKVANSRQLNTLHVLTHDENRGPGAAFATAFTFLSSRLQRDDWVITMEGDNTSRHELVRQMLTRTKEGFDVVLASPYMYGGGFTQTSFLRKLLSSGANLIVKDLLDIRGILTASSFFRLYSANALMRMQQVFGPGIITQAGFESMVEMVMKMAMLRLTISEVAMQLDSSRRKGKSKMKILKTIRGYLSLWRKKGEWFALVPKENAK